jgi:DNA polymerase-4
LAEPQLVGILGQGSGRHLHALAHNEDPRSVQVGRRRRSIGSQQALGRPVRSPEAIDTVVVALVDRVTRRLRAADRVARTVTLRLRFDDFSRATRSQTLPKATSHTHPLLVSARALLSTARPMIEGQGLTLVGIALGNLDDDASTQMALPFDRRATPGLDVALDRVRDRFGEAAVTRAVLLGRHHGPSVPLLPDPYDAP